VSSRAFPRKPEAHDRLLTLREAERLYGVTKWIVYSQAALGKIRAVRRGDEGRVYYLESEIKELNRNCEWAFAA
jgi:predicted DNA-binding transcriptional regulator AlpA